MSRVRASASATRDVSMVIHRRPHCSATYAVVPDPHVGSKTRSPGSVVIRMQRLTSSVFVWTTYMGADAPPSPSHQLDIRLAEGVDEYRTNLTSFFRGNRRSAIP